MGRARKAAARSAGAMGDSLDRFRGRVRGLTDQIFSLRGALAGLGVGLVLRGIIETSAEFQRLQTSLKTVTRSEEHTSELQSLMRISYAVFCLKKNNKITTKKPCSIKE